MIGFVLVRIFEYWKDGTTGSPTSYFYPITTILITLKFIASKVLKNLALQWSLGCRIIGAPWLRPPNIFLCVVEWPQNFYELKAQ